MDIKLNNLKTLKDKIKNAQEISITLKNFEDVKIIWQLIKQYSYQHWIIENEIQNMIRRKSF